MIVALAPQLFPLPQLVGSVHTLGKPWPGSETQALEGLGDAGDGYGAITTDDQWGDVWVDSSTPSYTPPSSSGGGFNSAAVTGISTTLANAAASILKAQFGQPNLAPGEYVNQATGVAYRQPTGVAITGTTLSASLGSFLPLLLLAGGALLVYKVVASR